MDRLMEALLGTIADPAQWDAALAALSRRCGASHALVSLRDRSTARIVIPDEVVQTFDSPLIYGFDERAVTDYLTVFVEVDPWTEIERDAFPYYPYEMSRHISPERLRRTSFWSWLEPLGIDDCVVCHLGYDDASWTALNLYFHSDTVDPQSVIEALRDLLPLLRKCWAASRRVRMVEERASALGMVLGAVDGPAILVAGDGSVVETSAEAEKVFGDWGIPLVRGRPLVLPAGMPVTARPGARTLPLARGPDVPTKDRACFAAFRTAEAVDGEALDLLLVMIEPPDAAPTAPDVAIWDATILTERERALVRHLAEGRTHKTASEEMGRSYQRIMQLWKSAREKLDVADVNELRVRHELQRRTQGGLR